MPTVRGANCYSCGKNPCECDSGTYFVIRFTDNTTYVTKLDKTTLLERINSDAWGINKEMKYYGDVPVNACTDTWGKGILIIKGNVVLPEPIREITEYYIE